MLVGATLAITDGDIGYNDNDGDDGDYELELTTLHPYFALTLPHGDLWASIGGGGGEVGNRVDDEAKTTHDADFKTFSIGGSFLLGNRHLHRLKGDLTQSELVIEDGVDDDQDLTITTDTIRLRVAGARPLSPTVNANYELGLRNNQSDTHGEAEATSSNAGEGTAVEATLGISGGKNRLTANADLHLISGDDYTQYGITGTVRLSPGNDGQGLSLTMQPSYSPMRWN